MSLTTFLSAAKAKCCARPGIISSALDDQIEVASVRSKERSNTWSLKAKNEAGDGAESYKSFVALYCESLSEVIHNEGILNVETFLTSSDWEKR